MLWSRRIPRIVKINQTVNIYRSPRRRATERRIVIPTDLMVGALRQLFPAERMVVFSGRQTGSMVRLTSYADVTEDHPSSVHVRACPKRLSRALLDCERTGAHFAFWLHSHPGQGAGATHPSSIDLEQESDLRRHYSAQLVCGIAVQDGWLRLWGRPLADASHHVKWEGGGLTEGATDDVCRFQLT